MLIGAKGIEKQAAYCGMAAAFGQALGRARFVPDLGPGRLDVMAVVVPSFFGMASGHSAHASPKTNHL